MIKKIFLLIVLITFINGCSYSPVHLIKGDETSNHTLYSSHSTWNSKADFINWTKSVSFREAHKGAGSHSDMYLGHPVFEGFEVVL